MPMMNAETAIASECGDCDWAGPAGELLQASDLDERLDPGSIVPAGECPKCGSLAYYTDEAAPEWTSQRKEVVLAARNAELLDALTGLLAATEDEERGADDVDAPLFAHVRAVIAKAKGEAV
jgi:hypothetical protein